MNKKPFIFAFDIISKLLLVWFLFQAFLFLLSYYNAKLQQWIV